ncbi:kinase-like domain-containing protein [Flagelloscypha sp. PMI_526]|nr:kinase-like domain-containing protein [Flagelloscypha sp. PMI_526]
MSRSTLTRKLRAGPSSNPFEDTTSPQLLQKKTRNAELSSEDMGGWARVDTPRRVKAPPRKSMLLPTTGDISDDELIIQESPRKRSPTKVKQEPSSELSELSNSGDEQGQMYVDVHVDQNAPTEAPVNEADEQEGVVKQEYESSMEGIEESDGVGLDAEYEDNGEETAHNNDADEHMAYDSALDSDMEDDPDPLTDEGNTLSLKDEAEQREILAEISGLNRAIPHLSDAYTLIDRLGTGTFSSVYKAIDSRYHEWDNSPWHGHHPDSSSAYYQSKPHPPGSNVFVAIKRIYVTSSPDRIKNEIEILEDTRGCRHVSQLITAFRHYDQVVVVMPYHRNEDFRDFYQSIPMACIKSYMRCLLRAMRDINSRGIIHRDVKPANFLFDPRTGLGTLCDFGLACRMSDQHDMMKGRCFHSPPSLTHPHGKLDIDREKDWLSAKLYAHKVKSKTQSEYVGVPTKDPRPLSKANRAGTRGFRAPEVLLKCGCQSGAVDVWSCGVILLFFLTKKFPLFQSNDDTEALMELAAILGSKKMQQTALLHSRSFSTNIPSITAEGMGWKVLVERLNPKLYVPPEPDPRYFPYSERAHAFPSSTPQELSPSREQTPTECPPLTSSSSPISKTEHQRSSSPREDDDDQRMEDEKRPDMGRHAKDVAHALDLLERLLHHEATKRITPEQALKHAFFKSPCHSIRLSSCEPDDNADLSDSEHFPHPWGQGVCGDHHVRDELGSQVVNVVLPGGGYEQKQVEKGKGVAIGRWPCEFHQGGEDEDSVDLDED